MEFFFDPLLPVDSRSSRRAANVMAAEQGGAPAADWGRAVSAVLAASYITTINLRLRPGESFAAAAAGLAADTVVKVTLCGGGGEFDKTSVLCPGAGRALGRRSLERLALLHCRVLAGALAWLPETTLVELDVEYCLLARGELALVAAAVPRLPSLRSLQFRRTTLPSKELALLLAALAGASLQRLELYCCNLGRKHVDALIGALPRLGVAALDLTENWYSVLEPVTRAAARSELELFRAAGLDYVEIMDFDPPTPERRQYWRDQRMLALIVAARRRLWLPPELYGLVRSEFAAQFLL